ncbi:hypothetical protein F8388_022498, partial [Cannabis sativa]
MGFGFEQKVMDGNGGIADIASYHSGNSDYLDHLDPDPIRIPTMCESFAHEKNKGCDSSLGITLEKKKRKNKGQPHVVDRIQVLKMVLGKRRGVGRLSKSQSTTRYTQTQVPTQQSLEKIQRLERLIIELQNQVQHISTKLPVEHCLPPDNKKEELIRKHGNMHSTRPSQHHMSHILGNGSVSSSQPLTSHSNIHGSQYQGQMSMPPPSQQPSSTPYYPNMYNSASQQLPPTPYQYPYMYGAPSQQPLPLYHYPNTYGFPLQQPMPPHQNPNTYGLPLQQPTPPYHNPNTYGLPLQQPTPPYHNANTYGPPLQQPMPSDHNPNTYAPPYSLENLRAKLKHFSTMNNFKKRALRAIAHELLSVEEIRNMQIRFHFMDTTRRGRINLDELRIGMHELEDHIPEAGVDMIMEAGDLNKDGYMDYGEFAIISFYLTKMHTKDEFIDKAFKYFDYLECGSIGISELRIGLTNVVEEKDIEEVIEAIMQEVDTDKDGRISYDEFAAMMKMDPC